MKSIKQIVHIPTKLLDCKINGSLLPHRKKHAIVWSFFFLFVRSLFCFALLCTYVPFLVLQSSLVKKELVALLVLCSECHAAVIVL